MGVLKVLGAALALLAFGAPCGVEAREIEAWRPLASAAAARFGLPEAWVLAVIEAESGGRTEIGGRPTTSHAGAMGLMQIMPRTWASLRAAYRLGSNPHNPADNIVAGTAYLRAMYDRFGYPGLFAAYNAGPGRYGDYVARGRPLPRETRDYVARILGRGDAFARPQAVALPVSGVLPGAAAAPVATAGQGAPPLFARSAGASPLNASNDPARPDANAGATGAISPPVQPDDPIFLLRRDGAAGRE
ncbi:MAG: lytic transglycosylase domain-containing protein [Sphingopyxis sp.]|nr:lytic transglycosylase domain-containing protein [Sphingopyxis sp.]